ncbi:MAG TPA: translocation/assembly module TamB domain-containing protein, partial [Burkholderiales bacterium]|nr:translocation/assembly module TamB domain-containing protein [Burkholderiales bacterium]
SLLGRVRVSGLTYTAETLKVRLDAVSLELSRNELLHGRLEVVAVEAALMDIETMSSATASQPPDTLALPFAIDIRRVRIAQAHIKGQVLNNLAFGYRGGKTGQALHELSVDTHWGQLTGDLSIGADRPFTISGGVKLNKPNEWHTQVILTGNLLETGVDARGAVRGAVIDATARIAPYEPMWLRNFRAHGDNINTAMLVPEFPVSVLAVDVAGAGTRTGWPAGTLTIKNAKPGEVTANRLPVATLSADYAMQDATTVALVNIAADLNKGGMASGRARISPDAIGVDLAVRNLDLRALHAPLRATQLNGTVKAEVTGDVQKAQINVAERGISIALNGMRRGDVITLQEFRAQAGKGTLKGNGELKLTGSRPYRVQATIDRLDPAAFGNYPQAAITGQFSVSGTAAPQWQADVTLQLVNAVYRGIQLTGNANGRITAQGARQIMLSVAAGGNNFRASGNFGQPGDTIAFTLDAPRLAQLNAGIAGRIVAAGHVSGDLQRPQIDVEIGGNGLVVQNKLRMGMLNARADGTLNRHVITLAARDQDYDLNARVEGGWDAARGWSGKVVSLQNAGVYPLQLLAPMPLAFAQGRYSAGPAQITVAGGRANLTEVKWRAGNLETSGDLSNLPFAPLLALAGMSAPRTTMRVSGSWSITTSPGLNGRITLARESGDIVTPGETAIALGLERLSLEARLVNGALDATLDVLAQTLKGSAHATATSLSPGAALSLNGNIDIASLRVLDSLWGTTAFLRGNATLTVNGSGTLGAPQLNGSVVAANLAIEAPQYGVRLRDGRLRADLDNKALILREFSIRGDEGVLSATGTMARAANGPTNLAWRAEHLRVLNRPEMRLKIDGTGTTALVDKKLVLRGSLTADEGYFEFDTPKAPTLASDIVVVGRPQQPARSGVRTSFQAELLDVDVALDAGNRFRVVGAGLDTELRGKLNLKSNRQGVLEARGMLASARGIYYAFGQRLDIERGRLIFDGRIDNPALDIVAKRRNLAVEPGVEVTGSVQVPNVRLISDPPVPDSEKLAWLTLGHGLQDATGSDLALLQTAAYALIDKGNSVPLTQRIANKLGLDELSFKGSGQAGGQVAALGKRLSDRLYFEYQQGLAATSSVLRLSLALTRGLSLRLEAGFTSSLGLYFTHSYN